MTITNTFNTRLAIRNLVIVAILSLAYLFGRHLQASHTTSGDGALKIKYSNTNNKLR